MLQKRVEEAGDSKNAEHCNDDASQLPRQQHIKQSVLNLVHF